LFCLFVLNAREWEKLFPGEIPLNRIWTWLIHANVYLCLKFLKLCFSVLKETVFVQ
jgi:hypothetical protein